MHVGVKDLDESVRFHSTLFASPPALRQMDYAKSMLDDPRINFAISAGRQPIGVNHWQERCRLGDARAGLGSLRIRRSCQVSVYVDPAAGGRGVGTQILAALIERSEARNVWTLQAGIFPENKASIALHECLAFEMVGTRRRLGKMTFGPLEGQWRDVLLLERRSVRAGND